MLGRCFRLVQRVLQRRLVRQQAQPRPVRNGLVPGGRIERVGQLPADDHGDTLLEIGGVILDPIGRDDEHRRFGGGVGISAQQ